MNFGAVRGRLTTSLLIKEGPLGFDLGLRCDLQSDLSLSLSLSLSLGIALCDLLSIELNVKIGWVNSVVLSQQGDLLIFCKLFSGVLSCEIKRAAYYFPLPKLSSGSTDISQHSSSGFTLSPCTEGPIISRS